MGRQSPEKTDHPPARWPDGDISHLVTSGKTLSRAGVWRPPAPSRWVLGAGALGGASLPIPVPQAQWDCVNAKYKQKKRHYKNSGVVILTDLKVSCGPHSPPVVRDPHLSKLCREPTGRGTLSLGVPLIRWTLQGPQPQRPRVSSPWGRDGGQEESEKGSWGDAGGQATPGSYPGRWVPGAPGPIWAWGALGGPCRRPCLEVLQGSLVPGLHHGRLSDPLHGACPGPPLPTPPRRAWAPSPVSPGQTDGGPCAYVGGLRPFCKVWRAHSPLPGLWAQRFPPGGAGARLSPPRSSDAKTCEKGAE